MLRITERERLQEIQDWDLFDYPVPETTDVTNPMYLHNMRQAQFRFRPMREGLIGTKDRYLYADRPRQHRQTDSVQYRSEEMEPNFQPTTGRYMAMYDPFERRYNSIPTSRDRTQESTLNEYKDRAGIIYPDMVNRMVEIGIPTPPYTPKKISAVNWMLATV
jgi:hypothetical protein